MAHKISCFLLFLCFFAPVRAGTELYTARAAVADNSAEARQIGIAQAFEQMLVKVTGNRSVLNHVGIPALLQQAAAFMQQYRYQVEETGDPEVPEQRYLIAHFDKAAVDRRLRDLGIPPWNAGRPRMLVWLAWENQGDRTLLDTERFPEVAQALNRAADRRGFPLRLPLFDLVDQGQLQAVHIWTEDEQRIRQASGRYPQNAVLTGRIRPAGEQQWSIDWTLFEEDGIGRFRSPPAALDVALAMGVDAAIDRLAQRYAPVATDLGVQHMQILLLDVADLAAYARALRMFEELDVVTDVAVLELRQQELQLRVGVQGDVASLHRALELTGEVLLEQDDLQVTGSASTRMATYRMR